MQEIEIFWPKFCPVFSASGKIVLCKYFSSDHQQNIMIFMHKLWEFQQNLKEKITS